MTPDSGCDSADLLRRSQPVVGQVRRHLDVGDHHVGTVSAGLADEVLGVTGHPDDVEARLLQHAHDARADQRLILPHDDTDDGFLAHGPTLPVASG